MTGDRSNCPAPEPSGRTAQKDCGCGAVDARLGDSRSRPMISESTRIRVMHAFIGCSSREFAKKLGISSTTLTDWERGRSIPGLRGGKALARLMKRAGLELTPEGYPVPKK